MASPPRPIVDADLHAFVDGQMDFERRSIIVQAMASDPELRAKVEQWRRQNEALTATFGGILREPVPLRLMPTNLERDKTAAAQTSPKPLAVAPRPRTGLLTKVAAVAAAAFVGGAAAVLLIDALALGPAFDTAGLIDTAPVAGGRSLALRAYEAHLTFANDLTHPVEVQGSDQAPLLKWLQHRLSLAIRIPDLHPQGWTLLGGRVLPGEIGPAAFLIYVNGVERIGLYMARTNARQADDVAVFDNGSGLASVGYWIDEPVGYALTTSRDGRWLERGGDALVQSIRTQIRDSASAH